MTDSGVAVEDGEIVEVGKDYIVFKPINGKPHRLRLPKKMGRLPAPPPSCFVWNTTENSSSE